MRGMSDRYSWTDPIKGLSGVFGTHPLNAISLLFVLEKIEALIPGKHLAAPSFPYPRKVNFLLADTKTTRRSCSSVGIRPLEIAAPVLFGLLVIRRTLFKRNPICGFEDDRLCGRAGPNNIRRFDELHDEKRSSILASPLHALTCMDRGLYLKAAVQVRDANPIPQGPQPCEGALVAQVGA